jgi:hypothetical protein
MGGDDGLEGRALIGADLLAIGGLLPLPPLPSCVPASCPSVISSRAGGGEAGEALMGRGARGLEPSDWDREGDRGDEGEWMGTDEGEGAEEDNIWSWSRSWS